MFNLNGVFDAVHLPSLRTISGWLGLGACFVSILCTCGSDESKFALRFLFCNLNTELICVPDSDSFAFRCSDICSELSASDSEKSVSVSVYRGERLVDDSPVRKVGRLTIPMPFAFDGLLVVVQLVVSDAIERILRVRRLVDGGVVLISALNDAL